MKWDFRCSNAARVNGAVAVEVLAFILMLTVAVLPVTAGITVDEKTVSAVDDKELSGGTPQLQVGRTSPKNPGNAIAVSALILTGGDGWQHVLGDASKQEKRKQLPPRTKDWAGYHQAHQIVGLTDSSRNNYHAECSATVSLAVRLSGVDDNYSCKTTAKQYLYMAKSSKWKEIGIWDRKSGEGAFLEPGDILITEQCREGSNGHILIYIGNDIAKNRYPDSRGYFVESAEGICWPSVTAKDDAKKGYQPDDRRFIVFRTTCKQIPKSRFNGVMNLWKTKFSPEVGLVLSYRH